jgi:hypothetical protein
MLDLLAAGGPHPDHAGELMLFGRFVGAWDMEGEQIAAGGDVTAFRGEWRFGWVLDGRAIQDVLVSPGLEYGTTVRFYDPATRVWEITWITPPGRAVRRLQARPDGDDIVLEGRDPAGHLLRWTFTAITPRSFTWSGFRSDDEAGSWRQDEEMRLTRRPDGSATPGTTPPSRRW